MNIYFGIFLIAICSISIFKNICFVNEIREINKTLEEVKKDNFNIRVRFFSSNKSTTKLAANINYILNEFQGIVKEKEYLEESRKKMLSNITHDLRTPLTSIMGYLESVQKSANLSEEEKKHFLDIAYSKAEKLHLLLESFFQFSKIEAEDILIKIEKINITNVVKDIIVEFYQEFSKENIEPIINIVDKDIFVLGDSKAIYRIVSNLLVNALRYGKDDRKIGISIRAEEDELWIDVWNGGKGIKKQDIPYIFDRLYTSDHSRNTSLSGSGLGLAIVKRLVEKLNGQVKVESIEDEITTFSFSLPYV